MYTRTNSGEILREKEAEMRCKETKAGLAMVGVILLSAGILAMGRPAIIINEVAWGGTAAGSQDEWIELWNTTDQVVDLSGWQLQIGEISLPLDRAGNASLASRQTSIPAGGYFLLERTDDQTVSDIEADIIYKGSLPNGGVALLLLDAQGNVVDRVVCADGGWPAGCGGAGTLPYATMERVLLADGTLDWETCDGMAVNGLDAAGDPLCGTPRALNSAAVRLECAPRVTVIAPSAGTLEGEVLVQWSATDPNGEDAALRIDLSLLSEDADQVSLIAENLANAGSYIWNSTSVSDAEGCTLRVVAHDSEGYEGVAHSPAFSIRNE